MWLDFPSPGARGGSPRTQDKRALMWLLLWLPELHLPPTEGLPGGCSESMLQAPFYGPKFF